MWPFWACLLEDVRFGDLKTFSANAESVEGLGLCLASFNEGYLFFIRSLSNRLSISNPW